MSLTPSPLETLLGKKLLEVTTGRDFGALKGSRPLPENVFRQAEHSHLMDNRMASIYDENKTHE